jgi:hypothetical protein
MKRNGCTTGRFLHCINPRGALHPSVLQLQDGSLHYLWGIDESSEGKFEESTALYYQSETDGKTIKLTDAYQSKAIAAEKRIVICYTRKRSPEKVYFRVLLNGELGPENEIEAAKGRKNKLWSDYMVLNSDSNLIWFVNTLARNTVYELKLVDEK